MGGPDPTLLKYSPHDLYEKFIKFCKECILLNFRKFEGHGPKIFFGTTCPQTPSPLLESWMCLCYLYKWHQCVEITYKQQQRQLAGSRSFQACCYLHIRMNHCTVQAPIQNAMIHWLVSSDFDRKWHFVHYDTTVSLVLVLHEYGTPIWMAGAGSRQCWWASFQNMAVIDVLWKWK